MNHLSTYYTIKSLIPRRIQVAVRQFFIQRAANNSANPWYIDPLYSERNEVPISWPNNKKFGLILTHDVETHKGMKNIVKLAELEIAHGFRSIFNIVPDRYPIDKKVLAYLRANNFEIGVHDLRHDGKLFSSNKNFSAAKPIINTFLKEWNARGFRGGAMHCNLEWLKQLDIQYDMSTYDIDPLEPSKNSQFKIFPYWIENVQNKKSYLELPYTLPQDFTVFVLLKQKNIDIWKEKLNWIAQRGGMALVITHPDYMAFSNNKHFEQYSVDLYEQFLQHIKDTYTNQYWHGLPQDIWNHLNSLKSPQSTVFYSVLKTKKNTPSASIIL